VQIDKAIKAKRTSDKVKGTSKVSSKCQLETMAKLLRNLVLLNKKCYIKITTIPLLIDYKP